MKKKTVKKKTSWLKLTAAVLVICFLAGFILAFARFQGNPGTAYAQCSVELTFDGAASGRAPNGEKYDMNDLRSDEIILEGLRRSGLDDRLTVEQVRYNLIVKGSYPDNVISQAISSDSLMDFTVRRTVTASHYIPTLYSVKLYNRFTEPLSERDVRALLQGVTDAFGEMFGTHYAFVFQPEDMPLDLEESDYSQQLDSLSVEISEAAAYAEELSLTHSSYLWNGMGFNDIYLRLSGLQENEINSMNASVNMNALTKNGDRMYMQNENTLFTLRNRLEKTQDFRDKIDALIARYEKNEVIYLSTTESLTKIDGNSSQTYDLLVERRKNVSDTIVQLNSRISTYEKRQEDLERNGIGSAAGTDEGELSEENDPAGNGPQTDFTAALEADIAQLREKYSAILRDFQAMLEQLSSEQLNESTMTVSRVGYAEPRLISSAFAGSVIRTAGPFCAVGLIVCLILIIAARRREEKAA